MFSQFANGEIKVLSAKDYEVEVSVHVVGFKATVESNKIIDAQTGGCSPLESDISGKDASQVRV